MTMARISIFFSLLIVSKSFHSLNAAPPTERENTLRFEVLQERLLFGLLPSLSSIVTGLLDFLGLSPLSGLLRQLGVTGLLKSTSTLTDFALKLPVILVVDPLAAFEGLFENLADVGSALQMLVVGRLTCTGCFFLMGLIQFLHTTGISGEDDIAEVFIRACVLFKIYGEDVCRGVVGQQKHILLTSLKFTPYNLNEICGFLVGYQCGTEPEEMFWKVKLPENKPPVVPVEPPPANAKKLVFLHFTDPHVDASYAPGSPSDCGEPLCCRNDSSSSRTGISGGPYGGLIICDIPPSTLELVFQDARKQYGEPDGIYWTGDQPPHNVWRETQADQAYYNEMVDGLLKKYYPNTPVYPAIGNHDASPVNNFPVESLLVPEEDRVTWLYEQAVDIWRAWLPKEALDTVRRGAFYSIPTNLPGFRVISINNNMCYWCNFWLLINATDPMDQLSFLIKELTAAEAKNEKVVLLLHIPPGNDDCLRVWSSNFYDIVNRFESTIVGQYSGHTHFDNFMVYYNRTTGRPTNIMYVTPSATTYESYNLAYRAIIMDGRPNGTYAVLDMVTHMMPLTDSNANGVPEFRKLYSTKEAYDMESLQPEEWDKVIKKLETNDMYWERFYAYFSRNSTAYPKCDDSCREGLICQLKSARSRDPSQCPD